jgi:hypothetical protein
MQTKVLLAQRVNVSTLEIDFGRDVRHAGRPNRISEGRDITKNWQPTQEGSITSNVFPKRAFWGQSKRTTGVAHGAPIRQYGRSDQTIRGPVSGMPCKLLGCRE